MLKFQVNHTTVIATFKDFILTVYVIIDDLYHQLALPEVMHRNVETEFSQQSEQLNEERVRVKKFQGLCCTRLINKILPYNLCLVLNNIFQEICELGKIKQIKKKVEQ